MGGVPVKAAVNGWEVKMFTSVRHSSCLIGSADTDIAEVPFTSNRKDPVNIQLFNNPECAAQWAFWRLWGSAFPFDVPSLSASLSGIFEDGIGNISSLFFIIFFPFNQSNLKGFQQYGSSLSCFVVLGVEAFNLALILQ